jgi:hypothetical protein
LFATAGCGGSDHGRVSGTLVRKDGAPIVGARVVANSSETGKTAYATTDANGQFKISEGLLPGNYIVVVLEDLGDPDRPQRPSIAAKYRDASRSGIGISVTAGDTTELDLTLDPP